jgi:hypothetical protein
MKFQTLCCHNVIMNIHLDRYIIHYLSYDLSTQIIKGGAFMSTVLAVFERLTL